MMQHGGAQREAAADVCGRHRHPPAAAAEGAGPARPPLAPGAARPAPAAGRGRAGPGAERRGGASPPLLGACSAGAASVRLRSYERE